MQSSKSYRKLKGFTLIESMLGIMVIGLVSGSIMLGITTVEKKIFKIKNDLSELEPIKKKQEEDYSLLKQNINTFTHEKIIRENQSIQSRLMLKLSSMRLLLERSRNIDLKDIYKN